MHSSAAIALACLVIGTADAATSCSKLVGFYTGTFDDPNSNNPTFDATFEVIVQSDVSSKTVTATIDRYDSSVAGSDTLQLHLPSADDDPCPASSAAVCSQPSDVLGDRVSVVVEQADYMDLIDINFNQTTGLFTLNAPVGQCSKQQAGMPGDAATFDQSKVQYCICCDTYDDSSCPVNGFDTTTPVPTTQPTTTVAPITSPATLPAITTQPPVATTQPPAATTQQPVTVPPGGGGGDCTTRPPLITITPQGNTVLGQSLQAGMKTWTSAEQTQFQPFLQRVRNIINSQETKPNKLKSISKLLGRYTTGTSQTKLNAVQIGKWGTVQQFDACDGF